MSSLHQSRARIMFDAACAFGVSASSVLAWEQTYAPAMLAVAGIAGLYGLVRAFDMRRGDPALTDAVAPAATALADAPDYIAQEWKPADAPEVAAVAPLEDAALEPKAKPRKVARSKAGRAKPEVVPEPVQLAVEPDVTPVADEPRAAVPDPVPESPAEVVPELEPEPEYAPVTPLFETEPFVRQQRAAFGRRKFG